MHTCPIFLLYTNQLSKFKYKFVELNWSNKEKGFLRHLPERTAHVLMWCVYGNRALFK